MRFIELQDSIFAYKDSIYFNPNNMIVNPTARHYQVPELPSSKYTQMTYTVKPGDNLGFISMWYNVRISDLRYWNNIRSQYDPHRPETRGLCAQRPCRKI